MANDSQHFDPHESGQTAGRQPEEPGLGGQVAATERISPIRVAWLAGCDTLSRIGRILQPLAVGLMDELVSVTVVLPERCDARELPSLPIEVLRYNRLHWLAFRRGMIASLAEVLDDKQVSLVHALDADCSELARRLAEACDLNYVLSSWRLGDARQLGRLDARAAGVLAGSEPVRQEMLGHRVAPVDRISLMRPGIYQVSHATCFDDPSRSIAIIAGGPMIDFHAYEAVLRAFADLCTRNYDCSFFIIASGPAEHRVRLLATQMGLNPRLTFIDRQQMSQLQGILKSADIYISPEPTRHVDIASLLAMAAGDPVLATTGQVDDFLIDGQTALTYRAGDATELSLKLVSLLEDRQRATELADGALAYLRENHSPARMVSAMAQVYRTAVSRARQAVAVAR